MFSLGTLATVLAYATFFESWYGASAVQEWIYQTKGFAVLLALSPVLSLATESTALWRVVHDICTPDMRLTGHPAPGAG